MEAHLLFARRSRDPRCGTSGPFKVSDFLPIGSLMLWILLVPVPHGLRDHFRRASPANGRPAQCAADEPEASTASGETRRLVRHRSAQIRLVAGAFPG